MNNNPSDSTQLGFKCNSDFIKVFYVKYIVSPFRGMLLILLQQLVPDCVINSFSLHFILICSTISALSSGSPCSQVSV